MFLIQIYIVHICWAREKGWIRNDGVDHDDDICSIWITHITVFALGYLCKFASTIDDVPKIAFDPRLSFALIYMCVLIIHTHIYTHQPASDASRTHDKHSPSSHTHDRHAMCAQSARCLFDEGRLINWPRWCQTQSAFGALWCSLSMFRIRVVPNIVRLDFRFLDSIRNIPNREYIYGIIYHVYYRDYELFIRGVRFVYVFV